MSKQQVTPEEEIKRLRDKAWEPDGLTPEEEERLKALVAQTGYADEIGDVD